MIFIFLICLKVDFNCDHPIKVAVKIESYLPLFFSGKKIKIGIENIAH